jgi:tyrosyl-tRNA synthetase
VSLCLPTLHLLITMRCSVKTRMSAHNGITFTEFTYQLLQGYDFYELFRTKGCTIQVGGSDQWGNILSGIDLINKAEGDSAGPKEKGFALTTPLLTTSQGEKFGKSAGNAVWLDEKLTSCLDFYQVY